MALILTPGQLSRRAELYYQLGQLTSAGLGVIRALEQLERNPPARAYRESIHRTLAGLAEGYTLSEALRNSGQWLPVFDIALLTAGEQSGRLDACFKVLANYYADRARVARQVLGDLAYPAFLFHFAIFILPFPELFRTLNWFQYGLKTFGVLVPLYLVVGGMIYAAQNQHGEQWRGMMELVLHKVPLLGTARRYLALARLATALEALLSAGVTIIEAWELAAAACGSPALRRTVLAWRPQVDAGQTPAEVLQASGAFPDLFVTQYATGEISGTLDETLRRLHQYYQEEGTRKMHAVAMWTPRGIYMGVVLMIAYKVVKFWLGYFGDLGKIMNGF
jgi:type IV pilus assembly protein PilC